MTRQQLVAFLKKHHLSPNFTYGQNFLIDDIVLEDIVDAAAVTQDDWVLEIGPGIGNLTEKLLNRAGFVLSVEKDPQFFSILKSLKKDHRQNFRFEIADVLDFNFQEVFGGRPYKVVANIPYYITGKIIQMLLTARHKPTTITLLVQKEVARNVAAKPGNLGILAISVQLYGDVKLVQKVLARSFFPAPKVDSSVVQIVVHEKPKFDIKDEKAFFGIIKACFAGKRKQIHNTLSSALHVTKDEAQQLLESLKINPAARPQELAIEQWVALSNALPK